ncbi:hypothetical protein F3J37_01325 [Pantoea sp. Al-1710]|uniref:Protein ninG n=1 Tax=Candidatus Pantoea communis TaxID=2608354 RepID=A0ABX0RI52_9GAMM|nr:MULTISPECIES: recombination protein NinG [Pantoea]NIG12981.1 hypothetical protein [Pantoea sp. Cy-640]NIG17318.1 hypothetical protein [Pantoea communis]
MIAYAKEKICPICNASFVPWMTTQHVCGNYRCALAWNRLQDERHKARAERRLSRAQSHTQQKTWSEYNKAAQNAFNRYIRIRDQGRACHACGCQLNDNNPNKSGAFVDASHYRSRGSASHLRFNVFNCVTCCWHCNRELSGNIPQLRKGLIKRFGLSIVIRLEVDNVFHRHSIPDLIRIADVFKRRGDHLLSLRKGKQFI